MATNEGEPATKQARVDGAPASALPAAHAEDCMCFLKKLEDQSQLGVTLEQLCAELPPLRARVVLGVLGRSDAPKTFSEEVDVDLEPSFWAGVSPEAQLFYADVVAEANRLHLSPARVLGRLAKPYVWALATLGGGAEHLPAPGGNISYRSKAPLPNPAPVLCVACATVAAHSPTLALCDQCLGELEFAYASTIKAERMIQRVAATVRVATGAAVANEDFAAAARTVITAVKNHSLPIIQAQVYYDAAIKILETLITARNLLQHASLRGSRLRALDVLVFASLLSRALSMVDIAALAQTNAAFATAMSEASLLALALVERLLTCVKARVWTLPSLAQQPATELDASWRLNKLLAEHHHRAPAAAGRNEPAGVPQFEHEAQLFSAFKHFTTISKAQMNRQAQENLESQANWAARLSAVFGAQLSEQAAEMVSRLVEESGNFRKELASLHGEYHASAERAARAHDVQLAALEERCAKAEELARRADAKAGDSLLAVCSYELTFNVAGVKPGEAGVTAVPGDLKARARQLVAALQRYLSTTAVTCFYESAAQGNSVKLSYFAPPDAAVVRFTAQREADLRALLERFFAPEAYALHVEAAAPGSLVISATGLALVEWLLRLAPLPAIVLDGHMYTLVQCRRVADVMQPSSLNSPPTSVTYARKTGKTPSSLDTKADSENTPPPRL